MKVKVNHIFILLAAIILIPSLAAAATDKAFISINTSSDGNITDGEVFASLKIAFLLGALTFLPSFVMTLTCFTRVSIVLSMTRQALGTMQTPPNQVLLGLALFISIAIMSPIFSKINTEALQPFLNEEIGHEEAMTKAFAPLRTFMLRHTREQDLSLFVEVTKSELPETPEELGPEVVVPAFLISELNSAFQIAFLIYLPFLILDMIISSVLTSMSMITLPPTVISLPIKLMLFVIIDGWHLIIGNLVKSYQV